MLEFHEIEFKYDASKIKLAEFTHEMLKLKPKSIKKPTGWDYYFTSNEKVVRFRADNLNEITVKQQTNKRNNFIRKEINLQIVPCDSPEKTLTKVSEFLRLQGYESAFAIHKQSYIYFFDKFDVVYYVVQNAKLEEIGRFIEIEMDEHFPWTSTEQAYKELVEIESTLKNIGLSSKTRLNKSLFQIFYS